MDDPGPSVSVVTLRPSPASVRTVVPARNMASAVAVPPAVPIGWTDEVAATPPPTAAPPPPAPPSVDLCSRSGGFHFGCAGQNRGCGNRPCNRQHKRTGKAGAHCATHKVGFAHGFYSPAGTPEHAHIIAPNAPRHRRPGEGRSSPPNGPGIRRRRGIGLIEGIRNARASIASAGGLALFQGYESAILGAVIATTVVDAPRIDDHSGTRPCTRRKRDDDRNHQTRNVENSHGDTPIAVRPAGGERSAIPTGVARSVQQLGLALIDLGRLFDGLFLGVGICRADVFGAFANEVDAPAHRQRHTLPVKLGCVGWIARTWITAFGATWVARLRSRTSRTLH
jgi:hypothetical protein